MEFVKLPNIKFRQNIPSFGNSLGPYNCTAAKLVKRALKFLFSIGHTYHTYKVIYFGAHHCLMRIKKQCVWTHAADL